MVFILVMIDHKHRKSLLLVRTRVMRTFGCLDILGKSGWGARKKYQISTSIPSDCRKQKRKKKKRKKKGPFHNERETYQSMSTGFMPFELDSAGSRVRLCRERCVAEIGGRTVASAHASVSARPVI